MVDKRLEKLADTIINYSCAVKKGERILIEIFDCNMEVAKQLVKKAYEAGGIPFVSINDQEVSRALMMGATKEQIEYMTKWDSLRMQDMQAYVAIRGSNNISEMSDVPLENMEMYRKIYSKQVHTDLRVKKTKWVVLRYPNHSMAQLADMSTEAFEDLYFNVCTLDYSKMDKAMDPLKKRMENADRVRINGKGTDLEFSIKGIDAKKCTGNMNIPDGEIYTAPVKDSVNGYITYNTPSIHQGFKFEDIYFKFENGKIVEAKANDTKRINSILNTDEGARYIGEFSFGVNPYILKPMYDTLFDEKIAGSIHFTPGASYDDADNGNRSAVHWDLVYIQRPEYGGGEIWFDDELIRKDGVFVPDDLKGLNIENLK
ncbi:MAG: aminopeptidase [Eubacteriales bacterium]